MKSTPPAKNVNRKISILNMTLAVLAGQVGCLTLVIVLLSVFGGLWLDSRFDTKPMYTIILMIVSIPISVLLMLAVVRSAVGRIRTEINGEQTHQQQEEETRIGRNKDA